MVGLPPQALRGQLGQSPRTDQFQAPEQMVKNWKDSVTTAYEVRLNCILTRAQRGMSYPRDSADCSSAVLFGHQQGALIAPAPAA
jgi:hypothetical protein